MDEKKELGKNLRSALKNTHFRERGGPEGSLVDIDRTHVEKKRKDLIDEIRD